MTQEPPDALPSSNKPFNSSKLLHLRNLTKDYISKRQYESAVFWADKCVSLSNGSLEDVYQYAQALFLTGQFHRAAFLLKANNLEKKNISCRFLTAQCHYECDEFQEALDILDMNYQANSQLYPSKCSLNDTEDCSYSQILPEKMESSLNLLRGKIYEALDNRGLAAECFREALQEDVHCYEAFELLVQHHMLSAEQESNLISSLPFDAQCSNSEESELIKFLYTNKLKKYDKPSNFHIPENFSSFESNLGILVNKAERNYYNCNFKEAYGITSLVLQKDSYNKECLPLHIAVLVELEKSNELFKLAHKLVDLYPSKAVAWFAVGCYYLLVSKNEAARRYLSKATMIDRVYGPAWLAYGHSFAVENEHDQAMAAYFTASQLMKGCHLPVLYIGLEYGLTNNIKLAERFFGLAHGIAPDDPFVLHEMGVVSFQSGDYEQSEEHFKSALQKIQSVTDEIDAEKWEPLFNNLAQTCRKLRKYEEALEFHQRALMLSPQNPSTLSSIGYVHTLIGNYAKAVDYFHKALGYRRHDTFSTTMLSHAIEHLMNEMPCCIDIPDALPPFVASGNLSILQDLSSESNNLSNKFAGDFIGTPDDYISSQPIFIEKQDESDTSKRDISILDSSTIAIDTSMDES